MSYEKIDKKTDACYICFQTPRAPPNTSRCFRHVFWGVKKYLQTQGVWKVRETMGYHGKRKGDPENATTTPRNEALLKDY